MCFCQLFPSSSVRISVLGTYLTIVQQFELGKCCIEPYLSIWWTARLHSISMAWPLGPWVLHIIYGLFVMNYYPGQGKSLRNNFLPSMQFVCLIWLYVCVRKCQTNWNLFQPWICKVLMCFMSSSYGKKVDAWCSLHCFLFLSPSSSPLSSPPLPLLSFPLYIYISPINRALLSSGSLEKPIGPGMGEMKLEGNVQGLYNPLAWENMPSSLREKFPHWKDASPSFSQSATKEDSLGEYLIITIWC